MEIKGSQFGVKIVERDDYIPVGGGKPIKVAPLVTILIEDDEYWSESAEYWSESTVSLDAGWLDDLINVLQQAKRYIKKLS